MEALLSCHQPMKGPSPLDTRRAPCRCRRHRLSPRWLQGLRDGHTTSHPLQNMVFAQELVNPRCLEAMLELATRFDAIGLKTSVERRYAVPVLASVDPDHRRPPGNDEVVGFEAIIDDRHLHRRAGSGDRRGGGWSGCG